jgi:hypothetical protein
MELDRETSGIVGNKRDERIRNIQGRFKMKLGLTNRQTINQISVGIQTDNQISTDKQTDIQTSQDKTSNSQFPIQKLKSLSAFK